MRARDCALDANSSACRNNMRTKRSKLTRNTRNGIMKVGTTSNGAERNFFSARGFHSNFTFGDTQARREKNRRDSRVRARNVRKQRGSLCAPFFFLLLLLSLSPSFFLLLFSNAREKPPAIARSEGLLSVDLLRAVNRHR